MTDRNYHNDDLAGTSREAERLIEQRIDELRAIALGSPPEPQQPTGAEVGYSRIESSAPREASYPRAHAHEVAPSRHPDQSPQQIPAAPPAYEADAVMRPTSATPTAPYGGAPFEQPQAFANHDDLESLVSRIEFSVQEDVARLEEMLHGWGNPDTAAHRLGEQLSATLQRVEHAVRKDVARVAELMRATLAHQGSDQTMMKALATWSVGFEGSLARRFEDLTVELERLGESIVDGRSANAAILASGIGEKVSDSLLNFRETVLANISRVEESSIKLGENVVEQLETLNSTLDPNLPVDLRASMAAGLATLEERLISQINEVHQSVANAMLRVADATEASADVAGSVRALNESFAALDSKLDAVAGRAELTHDDIKARLERFESTLTGAVDTLGQIKGTATGLDNALGDLERRIRDFDERMSALPAIRQTTDALGEKLDRFAPSFEKINRLDELERLSALERLNELERLNGLTKLDQLDALEKLSELDRIPQISSSLEGVVERSLADTAEKVIAELRDAERHNTDDAMARVDSIQKVIDESITRTHESLLRSISDLADTLAGSPNSLAAIERIQASLAAIDERVNGAREEFVRASQHITEAFSGSSISMQSIDRLHDTIAHLQNRVDKHAARVNVGMRQLSDELAQAIQGESEKTGEVLADMELEVSGLKESIADSLRNFGGEISEVVKLSTEKLNTTVHQLRDELLERSSENERELNGFLDRIRADFKAIHAESGAQVTTDLTRQILDLGSSINSGFNEIDQLYLSTTREASDATNSTLRKVTEALDTLRVYVHQDNEQMRTLLTDRLGAMRYELIGELDYNRLQAVHDTEQTLDSITLGMEAVVSQLRSTSARLATLESRVEEWFTLADD